MVETPDRIKFCVKLGYKSTEMFNLLQRGGDTLETKTVQCISGTHGLSKGKRVYKMTLGSDAGR